MREPEIQKADPVMQQEAESKPRWQPLPARERRVLGVLVEKAKTTPDNYPMSVNAICTGANQKNNRDPIMNLDVDDVEQTLDRLRQLGAIGEVVGGGRVSKFRHYLYEWLGVDKVELAVMAELLLRGAQTEGELRGRAARMEPIADLSALRPVLDSLAAKGLIVSLTPAGRGHMLSHALYLPEELARLKQRHTGGGESAQATASEPPPRREPPMEVVAAHEAHRPTRPTETAASSSGVGHDRELDMLRSELATLRAEFAALAERVDRQETTLARLRSDLGA